jgi:hypothetical protein
MPRDHVVPRFLLARWASRETGKIVVWDRRSGRAPVGGLSVGELDWAGFVRGGPARRGTVAG